MITSLSNERIKWVKALQSQHRARHKAERLVIEGANLIQEAVATKAPVEEVFYTETFASTREGAAHLDAVSQLGARLQAVSETVMRAISDTQTPQGILAVLRMPHIQPPEEFSFALVIDAVSDPGNMGSIMRVAAGAGVPLMFVTAGTVDLSNPKVLRSAMGAHFRLPVQGISWEGVVSRLEGFAIFIADVRSGAPYFHIDWTQPCALIVSDEAHGPSREAAQAAHAHATIPMPGGIESLNVAMATGILIYEMVRQRSVAGEGHP